MCVSVAGSNRSAKPAFSYNRQGKLVININTIPTDCHASVTLHTGAANLWRRCVRVTGGNGSHGLYSLRAPTGRRSRISAEMTPLPDVTAANLGIYKFPAASSVSGWGVSRSQLPLSQGWRESLISWGSPSKKS